MSFRVGILAGMHFQPFKIDRPCWHCVWYAGMDTSGTLAVCVGPGCPARRPMPERGCTCWMREIGADDDPNWSPRSRSTWQLLPIGLDDPIRVSAPIRGNQPVGLS